MFIKISWFS